MSDSCNMTSVAASRPGAARCGVLWAPISAVLCEVLCAAIGGAMGAALWAAPAAGAVLQHHVRLEGAGPRTIVFEAGAGDTLDTWQTIQSSVAVNCARTFSYNRAGYVDSDPADGTRDASTIVRELREELARRGVGPPYVLVGHSLGGLYMQYFARNYPADVAGLVLIDSTHWQQGLKVDRTADTPYQARVAVTLYMPLVERRELGDSAEAGIEVRDSPSAAAVPTIVLSSTRSGGSQTADQRAHAVTLQNSIAGDFPGARHLYVADSGHYIQRDRPAVVIDAIREMAGCEPGAR
jgi:pimeloyl-ACP methyl ester carboxylesterase